MRPSSTTSATSGSRGFSSFLGSGFFRRGSSSSASAEGAGALMKRGSSAVLTPQTMAEMRKLATRPHILYIGKINAQTSQASTNI